jgi:hypothetical protein
MTDITTLDAANRAGLNSEQIELLANLEASYKRSKPLCSHQDASVLEEGHELSKKVAVDMLDGSVEMFTITMGAIVKNSLLLVRDISRSLNAILVDTGLYKQRHELRKKLAETYHVEEI